MMSDENKQIELLLLHRAIASSHNGVTIARVSGVGKRMPLIYANPAFYRLSGYSPDEVIGNDCRFLQGDLTQQPGLQTLREALHEHVEVTVLLRNFRKDGSEFRNELTVSPVFDENGVLTHYVGVQQDVTQREEDAEAIATLNKTLVQKSRELQLANEGLSLFSASASHDLRAPLASIKGFSSALRKSLDIVPGTRPAHYLGRIESNVDQMEQLIEALLQNAQATSSPLNVNDCDLSAIAQKVVDAYLSEFPKLATTSVHITPDLHALGDPSLLQSVLQNLLGNALKYSSKTSDARVEFGRDEGGPQGARFYVKDNGAGFDQQSATQLFGAFQRFHSSEEFSGTGMGLATVQRILLRHGGTITAESAPGAGATFYFTLKEPGRA